MAVDFDSTKWPLIRVRVRGTSTDAEYREYCNKMLDALRTRRERCLILCDLSAMGHAPATQRAMHAEHLKDNAMWYRRYCAGVAVVAPNILLQGVVTAISWLSPPPYTLKVVLDVASAEAWLWRELDRAQAHS